MAWPYQFLGLTVAEKVERRLSLDRHAAYSQLSALVPIVIFLLARFIGWASAKISSRQVGYDAVPGSPVAKYKRQNEAASPFITRGRLVWWLGDDVVFAGQNWGRRDSLIFGTAYASWLLLLCFQGTGKGRFKARSDPKTSSRYLHIKKYCC